MNKPMSYFCRVIYIQLIIVWMIRKGEERKGEGRRGKERKGREGERREGVFNSDPTYPSLIGSNANSNVENARKPVQDNV